MERRQDIGRLLSRGRMYMAILGITVHVSWPDGVVPRRYQLHGLARARCLRPSNGRDRGDVRRNRDCAGSEEKASIEAMLQPYRRNGISR
jgi:hypothetical protein